MPYRIVEKEKAVQADVLALVAPLQQFNLDNGPAPNAEGIVLTVEDDDGNIVGGLFGKFVYGWLHVEYLVTPPDARRQGLGTQLLARAEAIASAKGGTGVWLSTLDFQARGFYEKLGYTVFGELPDFPPGFAPHSFLQKRLNPPK